MQSKSIEHEEEDDNEDELGTGKRKELNHHHPPTTFVVMQASHWDYFFDPEAWLEANVRVNGRIGLMGNVPPLDLGVRGTPDQVYAAAVDVLHQAGDHPLILSWGGATTISTPPENIRALAQAVREFNEQRRRS